MFKKILTMFMVVCMLISCVLPALAANDQKFKLESPVFSLASGTYTTAQTVQIKTTEKNADIRYTLDGSAPNEKSALYSGPINITATTTIKAFAIKNKAQYSQTVTAVYTIMRKAEAPTFSIPAGKYGSAQSVELGSSIAGATIRYTLDGSDPNVSSPVYAGPITVAKTTTIKAYVSKAGMIDSDVASAAYEIDPWTLVWQDEFDGTSVDTSKWYLENKGDGFGNNEEQYYSPDNAVVNNGELRIQARKVDPSSATNNKGYTSAKLMTVGKADWKYGKFEARIKLPLGQGFWPAFWMMPADSTYGGWAASGEIDIMEAKGRIPDNVSGTLHYGGVWPSNRYSGSNYRLPAGQDIAGYHTYAVEWEPGEFRWYVDGVLYQTQNNWNTKGINGEEQYAFPAPFDKDFYLILNLAIGGNFDGGVVPDTSLLPSEMDVDYVRVYELTGRPYKTVVEPLTSVEPLPADARPADGTGNLVYDVNYAQGIKENAEGVDADFGDYWNFIHNLAFGATATASVEDIGGINFAKIDVTNPGAQPYAVQLEQHITLGKGRWYNFSFDAKADSVRTLGADLSGGPDAGWAKYSDAYTVNLTTDIKHYTYKFQMTRDTDLLTRIEFNCATSVGTFWVGNVRVEETTPPAVDYTASRDPLPVSGNLIYNGAFDKYTIDRMSYWNVTKSAADADVSVPETTRELTVDINDGGTAPSDLTVDQKGLKLAAGSGYKISFKARAAADRTMQLKVANKDGTVNYLPEQTINLTTEMKTFEVPFKMGGTSDPESQLIFLLGGSNSGVFIDDVVFVKTSIDYSTIDMYPMKNGDFSKDLEPWNNWIGEGGAGAVTAENGEAKISVANKGNQPWALQFYQGSFNMVKDFEYVVAFDARSTAARDIEISLENSAYTRYFTKVIPIGTEMTHYEYTFVMSKSDALTFKFLLGNTNDTVPATAHDIFIDNVVCEVKDAKFLLSPVLNGQFNTGFDPWQKWTGDGGAVNMSVVNGELKLDVANTGANSWSVQAFQEGFKLENGQTYRLSFKARADAARSINVNIGKGLTVAPYFIPYMPTKTPALTTGMQEYVYEFTVDQPTDENLKIVFEAGNVAGGNIATAVYLDDIAINKVVTPMEKIAAPAFDPAGGTYAPGQTVTISCATPDVSIRYTTDGTAPAKSSQEYTGAITLNSSVILKAAAYKDGMLDSEVTSATYIISADGAANIIQNGTFDAFTAPWQSYTADGSNAAFTVEDGKLKVDFPNYDGWFPWSTQLYQTGIKLQAGKTYVLSFDMSATQAKPISFDIENTDNYNIKSLNSQSITPEGTMTTYTYEFTAPADEANGKLVFLLGSNNVPGPNFVTHSFYFDNIVLKEKVSPEIIQNGTFDAFTAPWQSYTADGSNAAFTVEAGKLKVDFPNYDGWFPWSTQLYQTGIKLQAGKTYVLSFDMSATQAKPISFDIENTDNYNIKSLNSQSITPEGTMTTYTYEFTAPADEANGKLVFLLGSNNVPGPNFVTHSFYFDNISLKEKM